MFLWSFLNEYLLIILLILVIFFPKRRYFIPSLERVYIDNKEKIRFNKSVDNK